MTIDEAIEFGNMWLQINEDCKDSSTYKFFQMAIKALEQQPCEDAISRQAVDTLVDELVRAISDERCFMSRGRSTATIMQDILELPSVTPQPKVGRWINAKVGKLFPSNDYKCSECGNILNFDGVNCGRGDANYCPNCGANKNGGRRMTLDEAIKHAEEVAKENEEDVQIWHELTKNGLVDFCDKRVQAENNCVKCAKEHRQLAKWLKELKQFREQTRWIPVSERSPKDNGWYQCTIILDNLLLTVDLFYKNGKWLDNQRISMFNTYDIYGYGNSTEKHKLSYQELISEFDWTETVVAWMPSPTPYKVKNEEREGIVNMTKETIIKSALTFLVQKQIEQGSHGYAMDEEENKCSWSEVLEWLNQFDNTTSGIECDVLNKIKAEFISLYPRNYAGELELGGICCEFSLNQILKILDKYKSESG